ncbi:MAG: CYTH domain-containing protein [Lachnospiraceae bacterium]|nr:CYTH domain-containing protein [Lachnospiraceae bacterium]
MEIERKYLVSEKDLPVDLESYDSHELEQAYIITNPVLRVRKKDDKYILTYKGEGFMKREEHEFPLNEEAYKTLLGKADGMVISKTRYLIPEKNNLTIELDVFHGELNGLYLAEVEFENEESANSYVAPDWFGRDVTDEGTYHNSTLSKLTDKEAYELVEKTKSSVY